MLDRKPQRFFGCPQYVSNANSTSASYCSILLFGLVLTHHMHTHECFVIFYPTRTSVSAPTQLLENKEDTFIASLAEKLAPLGYSIAPTFFTPTVPPTAAEAAAEAAAAAAAALEDATAQHADATAWLAEAMGGPGEAGAQIRAKEAEEKLTAAEKKVEDLAAGGAAAAAAAVVSEKMLGQYDVVFWKPRKTMTVSEVCTAWPP